MSGSGAFGPFALVVESGDGSAFLDPESPRATSTLTWVQRIMERKEYRSLHFRELLGVEDSGANLVGVVAVALHPRRHKFIPDLWQALDRGTEAAPQIVFLLRQTDPEFVAQGKERITNQCMEPRAEPLEEGVEASPEATGRALAQRARDARCVAALLTMMADAAGETEWTERRQADSEVRALLEKLDPQEPPITQWGDGFLALLERRHSA